MAEDKKLLEIQNLRKYFPIKGVKGPGVQAVQDVSLYIKKGETLGLVGESGCGKTTLGRTILRLYEPTGGKIIYDGEDITNVPLEKRGFNIVFQDYALFPNLTAYENIVYGLRNKPGISTEQDVQDFIHLLGLEEHLNKRISQLSGGQKQRISIARVFLKNPSILILDEATSALDNESERWIQQSLEELAKNRTTITIAHRLSTIRNADEILVVADNGIAERGTHDELIARGGIYAHYYEMS